MELEKAKEIINIAIDVAMKKGCYSLSDNEAIIAALRKINSVSDVEFGEIKPVK